MQFISVQFIDRKPRQFSGVVNILSKICINDFWEIFEVSLDWWTAENYERQWKEGLARLKTHDRSCLVMRIQNPNTGPYIDWFLLYKEGTQIIIHNHVLFREYYDQYIGNRLFTIENCYDFIEPRSTELLSNGNPPATWIVDISNSEWYNNL